MEYGEYTAGDKIPSEIELARQFDVSRLTVNTAVKELANSGIVERVQGKGTFVRFVPGQSFSSPMAFSGGIKIAPFEHQQQAAPPAGAWGHQGGCCFVPEAGPDGRKPLCL